MKRRTFITATAATAAYAGIPRLVRASEEVTLATATGNIAGTLELPATANGPVPVVLIIAGSGPTDRDGNSRLLPGKNDSLKLLALGLAARGVASLRYDKRAIGASAAAGVSESALRFDTYIDDAIAWLVLLRAQKRFSRAIVAGHSEGSLIGMIAAARTKAEGFVSLEGVGRPAATVLRERLAKQFAQAPELGAQSNHILDELIAGRTVSDVPPLLAILYRPSVQPYIISWLKYDPAREIAAVRSPAAIVQGTADVQATKADSDALHAALPAARYVVVEGMNHVLKHAPDTSSQSAILAGYSDSSLPVEPVVIDTVAAIANRL